MRPKITDVHDGNFSKNNGFDLHEIGTIESFEPVEDGNIANMFAEEAFMNEILTIIVPKGSNKEDLPFVNPGVNGINQPIIRGVPSKIKRKYVEALARSSITRYNTEFPDHNHPESVRVVPEVFMTAPFSILHDPSGQKGVDWIEGIQRSAGLA